jgi:hypothetical protein
VVAPVATVFKLLLSLKVVKNYKKLLAIGLYTNSVVRALFSLLVSCGVAVTQLPANF